MLCLNTFFTTYYLENIQTTLVYRFFLLFFPAFRFELWGSFPMNPPKVWKTSWFYIKASKHYHITPLCPIFERSRHHMMISYSYIFFSNIITLLFVLQFIIHEICSIKQNEKSCNISIYTSSLELLLINWSIFPITF